MVCESNSYGTFVTTTTSPDRVGLSESLPSTFASCAFVNTASTIFFPVFGSRRFLYAFTMSATVEA